MVDSLASSALFATLCLVMSKTHYQKQWCQNSLRSNMGHWRKEKSAPRTAPKARRITSSEKEEKEKTITKHLLQKNGSNVMEIKCFHLR
jgi:hypothetical protein